MYTINAVEKNERDTNNCSFSVEEIFFYIVNCFPRISFSCSHTTHGGFRGEIVIKQNDLFTTDDISVIISSYDAVSLHDISEHCYRLALALANRQSANHNA